MSYYIPHLHSSAASAESAELFVVAGVVAFAGRLVAGVEAAVGRLVAGAGVVAAGVVVVGMLAVVAGSNPGRVAVGSKPEQVVVVDIPEVADIQQVQVVATWYEKKILIQTNTHKCIKRRSTPDTSFPQR